MKSEIEIQDRVSEDYEALRYSRPYSRKYQAWWTDKMLSLIKPENLNGAILDDGCGIGTHFASISRHSRFVVGLDISQQMLFKAKTRMENVILADAQRLPFADKEFNVVFARSLLHHLPDPRLAVLEIDRVLKVGGEAVFSDTNNSMLSNIPRKIHVKKGKSFSEMHKNFKTSEFLDIIGSAFKIDKVYYFGYLAYPLLGFPDVSDVFRFVPFKNCVSSMLMGIDNFIACLPWIRRQGWGIIVKASKKEI